MMPGSRLIGVVGAADAQNLPLQLLWSRVGQVLFCVRTVPVMLESRLIIVIGLAEIQSLLQLVAQRRSTEPPTLRDACSI